GARSGAFEASRGKALVVITGQQHVAQAGLSRLVGRIGRIRPVGLSGLVIPRRTRAVIHADAHARGRSAAASSSRTPEVKGGCHRPAPTCGTKLSAKPVACARGMRILPELEDEKPERAVLASGSGPLMKRSAIPPRTASWRDVFSRTRYTTP